MRTKLYNKRLLKLADWLEKLNPKTFNLGVIIGLSRVEDKKFWKRLGAFEQSVELKDKEIVCSLKGGPEKALKCGTAACAIGWCPSVFPRDFKWTERGYVKLKRQKVYDFVAVQRFFKIGSDDADWLFNPDSYGIKGYDATPKQVAKRIRRFIKEHTNV